MLLINQTNSLNCAPPSIMMSLRTRVLRFDFIFSMSFGNLLKFLRKLYLRSRYCLMIQYQGWNSTVKSLVIVVGGSSLHSGSLWCFYVAHDGVLSRLGRDDQLCAHKSRTRGTMHWVWYEFQTLFIDGRYFNDGRYVWKVTALHIIRTYWNANTCFSLCLSCN